MDMFYAMQMAAERHLALCEDALEAEEEAEDLENLPPSPAVGPFCGCQTCVVREVLAGAWPKIEEYFALKLTEPGSRQLLQLLDLTEPTAPR